MKVAEDDLPKLQALDDLYYELTCKEDVALILSQHKKMIDNLSDIVALLARAETYRIDRANGKK